MKHVPDVVQEEVEELKVIKWWSQCGTDAPQEILAYDAAADENFVGWGTNGRQFDSLLQALPERIGVE